MLTNLSGIAFFNARRNNKPASRFTKTKTEVVAQQ